MFRGVWKIIGTKARKIGVTKTKERREERERRKKIRRKKEGRKTKGRKNNGDKEGSRRMRDLE